jgi:hypothetical protein
MIAVPELGGKKKSHINSPVTKLRNIPSRFHIGYLLCLGEDQRIISPPPPLIAPNRPLVLQPNIILNSVRQHLLLKVITQATCFDYRLIIFRPIFVTRCYAHFGTPLCLHPWNT